MSVSRRNSVSLPCVFHHFFFFFLPFSPTSSPVFNLWQLLRSHSRDFLDQKHLHASFKQMQKENSKIMERASEPCWTWIKRADCDWLYDPAVGVKQRLTWPGSHGRRAPTAAYREQQCKRNVQHSPEKLCWIITALPYNICQLRMIIRMAPSQE